MDDAGFATAHLVGNSLGGFVALQLAARGRARIGRGAGARRRLGARRRVLPRDARALRARCRRSCAAAAQHRRRDRSPHRGPPPRDAAHHHQLRASARRAPRPSERRRRRLPRPGADGRLRRPARATTSTPSAITCPVRIIWGTADRLLPWPETAARYRDDWLPHADWIELDGIGHCPQLDVPTETAHLITGFTDTALT